MGYFRLILLELEESVLVDGANRWEILTKIILPLAVPGLISAGICPFTLSWNEFILRPDLHPVPSENKTILVGVLTELVCGDVFEWGSLMAGALFGSLPVVILYSFFVDYYVSSMTGRRQGMKKGQKLLLFAPNGYSSYAIAQTFRAVLRWSPGRAR